MLQFQDKRLYVKGTCNAWLSDPVTGQILYQDNKFQTNNITTSVTLGEIRAGLGNTIAAVLPSDSSVEVAASSAAFSLWGKAAQVGAELSFNAPAPRCVVVTATGSTLSVDVTGGVPAAQYGYAEPLCYVLTVGAANLVASSGTAYPISAEGDISGFAAENGKQYQVVYWTRQANAQSAALSTLFNPGIYHFTTQIAVFTNSLSGKQGTGTRSHWLFIDIPYLQMNATGGGVVGDQTTADTTSLSGYAISGDEAVLSGACQSCSQTHLAYYTLVPDDQTENIEGLAVMGGNVTVPTTGTATIPVKYIIGGSLVQPNMADLTFEMTTAIPNVTVGESTGVLTASGATAAAAGECTITVTGKPEIQTVVNVTVADA